MFRAGRDSVRDSPRRLPFLRSRPPSQHGSGLGRHEAATRGGPLTLVSGWATGPLRKELVWILHLSNIDCCDFQRQKREKGKRIPAARTAQWFITPGVKAWRPWARAPGAHRGRSFRRIGREGLRSPWPRCLRAGGRSRRSTPLCYIVM